MSPMPSSKNAKTVIVMDSEGNDRKPRRAKQFTGVTFFVISSMTTVSQTSRPTAMGNCFILAAVLSCGWRASESKRRPLDHFAALIQNRLFNGVGQFLGAAFH